MPNAAHAIGVQRCFIVRTRGGSTEGPKDANDALRAGKELAMCSSLLTVARSLGADLNRMLKEARVLPHEQITTFSDLRDSVRDELAEPTVSASLLAC